MITNVSCGTCKNKEICRYMNIVEERIKHIAKISNDGILQVYVTCKYWDSGRTAKEIFDGEYPYMCEVERCSDNIEVIPKLTTRGIYLTEKKEGEQNAW